MKSFAFVFACLVASSAFADCMAPTAGQFIDAAMKAIPTGEAVSSISIKDQTATSATVTITLVGQTKAHPLKIVQSPTCDSLAVQIDANPNQYQCQTGYVDCMPRGGSGADQGPDYCSDDFRQWSIANCGGAPSIVY